VSPPARPIPGRRANTTRKEDKKWKR